MERPTVTRRKSIAIGATALTAGLGGLALASDPAGAQASVDMGSLDVTDGQFSPRDGEVHELWASVAGEYQYQVNADPADWQAFLLIGDGSGDTEAVGLTSGDAAPREGSGTYALRGPITTTGFYDAADFRIPDGEHAVTVTIPVSVAFLVRDADGATLADARVTDAAVVTVDDEGMPRASLSGSATIVMQDDAEDPTPELPEA